MGSAISDIGRAVSQPLREVGRGAAAWSTGGLSELPNLMKGDDPPAPPGTDPNLEKLHQDQLKHAKDFRANIPEMQREMGANLASEAGHKLNAGLMQQNQAANRRGLLYSGINEGQKMGMRGQSQAAVAKGTSDINSGLLSAANTLDTQAVQTGVGIQQAQQEIQNQIYSQAQARLAAQNQMIGSAAGTVLTAGLLR